MRLAAGEGGRAGSGGSGQSPSGSEEAMQLPRLLLGSARRLVLGSAEAALCGELCGLWGETESLTPGPREGMVGVGAPRFFRFLVRSRPITLGTGRFSARIRFLFLQIPGYWG